MVHLMTKFGHDNPLPLSFSYQDPFLRRRKGFIFSIKKNYVSFNFHNVCESVPLASRVPMGIEDKEDSMLNSFLTQ